MKPLNQMRLIVHGKFSDGSITNLEKYLSDRRHTAVIGNIRMSIDEKLIRNYSVEGQF